MRCEIHIEDRRISKKLTRKLHHHF